MSLTSPYHYTDGSRWPDIPRPGPKPDPDTDFEALMAWQREVWEYDDACRASNTQEFEKHLSKALRRTNVRCSLGDRSVEVQLGGTE